MKSFQVKIKDFKEKKAFQVIITNNYSKLRTFRSKLRIFKDFQVKSNVFQIKIGQN